MKEDALDEPLLPGVDPARLEPFVAAAGRFGTGMILVPLDGRLFAVTTAGPPGATALDPGAPDLLAQLDRHGRFDDPTAVSQWRGHARQAVNLGIARRQRGELAEAYVCQRFALFVALREGSADGVSAIAANVWILREAIRNVTQRARSQARDGVDREDARRIGELLDRTLDFIRHDARLVADAVRDLARAAEDPRRHLAMLLARLRLARMAGDGPARDEALAALLELAGEVGDSETPFLAAAEGVAQMELLDVLSATGTVCDAGSPVAWARYLEARPCLFEARDPARVASACIGAFEHLCYLRLRATTAGGAFGHEVSYAVSSLLQVVGRDLVGLLHLQGRDQDALGVAETLLARSMADWMARTHGGWATPPEMTAAINALTGSLNAVAVAGLDEIRAAAGEAGAPLLYYLRQRDRYLAWLVRRDGRIVTAEVASPASHVAFLLPGIASEERDEMEPEPARRLAEAIDRELGALHDVLFPPALREALADQGERLVIVADPAIQSVPFCALRTPAGRFLIEEREVVFWPSVTSWLNLEAGARRPPAERARLAEPRRPLVIGVRSFDREYPLDGSDDVVTFPDLDEAVREAEQVAALLGTEAVLEDDATVEALLDGGRGTEVVHLATHGYLDPAHPRRSFLALADGAVTAGALYRQDRGLQTELVVLSACETALGGDHPDSVIGLANAFLIAGAASVVSTLWPIADEATPAFMAAFYGAIREGEDLAASLRRAQRALLAEPQSRDPFFWAPFVLTGRVANPLAASSAAPPRGS